MQALTPQGVVDKFGHSFPRVVGDSDAATKQRDKVVATYERLVNAGLGNANSTTLNEMREQWTDALLVSVSVDEVGNEWFHTFACSNRHLELMFDASIGGRRHRVIAVRAAKALGYDLVPIDGD